MRSGAIEALPRSTRSPYPSGLPDHRCADSQTGQVNGATDSGAEPRTTANCTRGSPGLSCPLSPDGTPDRPSYTDQFEALLNDPDTVGDPARKAYCQLALGRIGEVVDAFEASFDKGPHQEWIDRLELVARAPDDQPLDRGCGELYEKLVTTNVGTTPLGRSPAGNTITRLITARWLAANPFAMPDPDLRRIIRHAYGEELPPLSRRPDVAALYEAARLAADPLL
jgi:hypothetical protein